MPKCPKCSQEINQLVERGICNYDMTVRHCMSYDDLEGTGETDYDNYDVDRYECPNCGAELFHRYDDAEAFLRPEKKNEELVEG